LCLQNKPSIRESNKGEGTQIFRYIGASTGKRSEYPKTYSLTKSEGNLGDSKFGRKMNEPWKNS
jgi:hypothetical protein